MFGLGMQELLIVGIIAVLLFGKRLPDVARSLGSSYREFRKGLNDLQSEMNSVSNSVYSSTSRSSSSSGSSYGSGSYEDYDDYQEATSPKFEPPASEPLAADATSSDAASSDSSADASLTGQASGVVTTEEASGGQPDSGSDEWGQQTGDATSSDPNRDPNEYA